MALLASFTPLLPQAINKFPTSQNPRPISPNFQNPNTKSPSSSARILIFRRRARSRLRSTVTCQVCTDEPLKLDRSSLTISEAFSEDELWAASSLRARSFYAGNQDSFGIQDHMRYLAEREFEALKERIAGKRAGFGRVSCINATIPLSQMSNPSDDLCSVYQYSDNGEDRVVIGTLDLNQCPRLPDEIAGKRPEGTGSDLARAYLGNVCVAKELHRNGIAYSLVVQSKKVAVEWGICDLYVHVAVDNEPAKKLYMKSGFIYENEEPAWQARFLDRPRRILLWTDLYST